jgi:hypothetical protein
MRVLRLAVVALAVTAAAGASAQRRELPHLAPKILLPQDR